MHWLWYSTFCWPDGIVGGDYLVNYRIPHRLSALNTSTTDVQAVPSPASGGESSASGSSDWGQKFQDKFSDTVVSSDTVYKSPNISVEITQHSYDSGALDMSANGGHSKYGTKVFYTLADIYVRDISACGPAIAPRAPTGSVTARRSAPCRRE